MKRTVTVVPEDGLRAHPASKFVETANRFDADVQPGRADEDDPVPAANIFTVAGFGVGYDESVRLVAEGDDAEAALGVLESILSMLEAKQ